MCLMIAILNSATNGLKFQIINILPLYKSTAIKIISILRNKKENITKH